MLKGGLPRPIVFHLGLILGLAGGFKNAQKGVQEGIQKPLETSVSRLIAPKAQSC